MSETSTILGALAAGTHVMIDRAAAELRAARPVVIEAAEGMTIVAALDGIAPSTFAILKALPDAALVLSAQRAISLQLNVPHAVAIPLRDVDLEAAMRLATAVQPTPPAVWQSAGNTSAAAIDLCKSALLLPAVIAAPVAPDARLPFSLYRISLDQIAARTGADRHELEIVSEAEVPLTGNVATRFVVLRGGPTQRDQIAVIVGKPDPAEPTLVRVHSACLTGDLFGSLRCDCGDQLRNAVTRLNAAGGGVLLYLDQEGRGIGIGNKMRAYALQDEGFDTIDADRTLGFGPDERRYENAAAILAKLGYRRIVLLTNNPSKIEALERAGIAVVERQSLTGVVTAQNLHYLYTKAERANHMLDELLELEEATVEPRG